MGDVEASVVRGRNPHTHYMPCQPLSEAAIRRPVCLGHSPGRLKRGEAADTEARNSTEVVGKAGATSAGEGMRPDGRRHRQASQKRGANSADIRWKVDAWSISNRCHIQVPFGYSEGDRFCANGASRPLGDVPLLLRL